MKKCLLSVLLTLSAAALCAQRDTSYLETRTETGNFQPGNFFDGNDEVYGIRQTSRWMIKWSPLFDSEVNLLNLGAEIKLGHAWSIQALYRYKFDDLTSYDVQYVNRLPHTLLFELRYYIGMARRIREGRSANNCSGNYVGLEAGTRFSQFSELFERHRSAGLRFGMQRRFLRNGYFDLSVGASAGEIRPAGNRYFELSPRVAAGFVLAETRSLPTDAAQQCSALRCFLEERRMLKINLLPLIWLSSNGGRIGTDIRWEQKIGASPWSTSLSLSGSAGIYDTHSIKGNAQSLGLGAELRYYNTLRRRIATGKSGNNLSGLYTALTADYEQNYTNVRYKFSPGVNEVREPGKVWNLALQLGWQQRILRRGYLDVSGGSGYGARNGNKAQIGLYGKLALGMAF